MEINEVKSVIDDVQEALVAYQKIYGILSSLRENSFKLVISWLTQSQSVQPAPIQTPIQTPIYAAPIDRHIYTAVYAAPIDRHMYTAIYAAPADPDDIKPTKF